MKQQKKITVKKYILVSEKKRKRLGKRDKQTLVSISIILAIIAVTVIMAEFVFVQENDHTQTKEPGTQAQIPIDEIKQKETEEKQEATAYLEAYVEQNFNTIGYIKIDDTNIDYPVLQTDNNQYYMTHNFNGKQDSAGAIFMDFRCDIDDFEKTRNIIIYGHRMKDGSMFKDLLKYKNPTFFRDHKEIRFDTLNESLVWEVLTVFETSTDDYYIETVFPYDEIWIDFMQTYYEKSMHDHHMSFYDTDIILTLSTCGTKDKERFVVMAKLRR